MLAKVSILIYIIAAILHFIDDQIALFILSIVLGIITLCLSLYMSFRELSPQLKEYRETIYRMEAEEASDDEILNFMDQEIKVNPNKIEKTPLWMNFVMAFGIVSSIILCGIGIINWL